MRIGCILWRIGAEYRLRTDVHSFLDMQYFHQLTKLRQTLATIEGLLLLCTLLLSIY
jgi:hypothetical protein